MQETILALLESNSLLAFLGAFGAGSITAIAPCASAPLVAIITVATNSGYIYAYGLILTFALGHSLLLLIAGVSVGFTQSITSSRILANISNYINKGFALILIVFGGYFAWHAYLQF